MDIMKIFDSHCHINDPVFNNDIENTIKRAAQNMVSHMLIAGVTLETCKKALKITKQYKNIYASIGIHPHDTDSCSFDIINELKKMASDNKVVAWGEIGLDFNRMHSKKENQEKWFEIQLDEAEKLDLPVIFHERDTEGRLGELLASRKKGIKGVVHCFSGSRKDLELYLDLGLHIGITGVVTIMKRGKNLRELLAYIPEEKILIETDAPYLTPAPERNRSKRNEPSFLPAVMKKIAEVKSCEIEILADQVFSNTLNLFNIES